MKPQYSEKLKDPRWQKRRLEVLEKASWTCSKCGNKDEELHVHHVRYLKNSDPWAYPDWMLLCVCKKCHDALENAIAAFRESTAEASIEMIVAGIEIIRIMSSINQQDFRYSIPQLAQMAVHNLLVGAMLEHGKGDKTTDFIRALECFGERE